MLRINKKFNLTKLLFEGNNISSNQSALVWNDTEISRKELFNNIIKNAEYLLKSGLNEGERVILLLNDSPAIYYFFLGAISIGAIPVLINPKTKLEDLIYILNDSKATFVVTEILPLKKIEKIFASSSYINSRNKIIVQDSYISNSDIVKNNREYFYPRSSKAFFLEEDELEMSFVLRDKDTPAFWQYTSGTTGRPKAVIHSQISMLSNTINFAEKTLQITNKDRIYSIPKMFFGYGLGNSLFFPIWTGATVFIDDNWPKIEGILRNLKLFKPTILFAIPKIYNALLQQENLKAFKSVRVFYSAGSNLSPAINEKWKHFAGKHITQGIGCTEIGHVYLSNTPAEENINSTGKPIHGFNVKLNENDENNSGEIYVKPSYRLLGYKGKYNQDKFSEDNWYKTGDNFAIDNKGNYKFLARIDEMFKVNGRKVIPSIIENYILQNHPIFEAVYIGLEDEALSDIITYLCLTLNSSIDEQELIEKIKKDLCENFESYLRPQKIVIFKNFEYNSNGKIMRQQIKEQLNQPILG